MKIELNALIKEWASYNINLRNLSENSVKAYSLDLKDFLHFSFQESQPVLKSDLSNISSHKIRLWILSLRNRSVKASSLSRKISSLKSFFQWLENSHNIFNDERGKKTIQSLRKQKRETMDNIQKPSHLSIIIYLWSENFGSTRFKNRYATVKYKCLDQGQRKKRANGTNN